MQTNQVSLESLIEKFKEDSLITDKLDSTPQIENKETVELNLKEIRVENEEFESWEKFEELFNKIFYLNEDGSYLNCDNPAIVFKDAFLSQNLGVENTAKEQSIKLYNLVKKECKRSKVMRKLICIIHKERVENKHLMPIEVISLFFF